MSRRHVAVLAQQHLDEDGPTNPAPSGAVWRPRHLARLGQCEGSRDLLPQRALRTRDRMLLGRGVVAAADELLLAWLDNESNVSREDVVELVMVFFDAVADRVGD